MTDSSNDRTEPEAPNGTLGDDDSALDDEGLAQLFAELEANPPFACPATYHGPADEGSVKGAMFVFQVQAMRLRQQHPWLNFDTLDSITFHSDYAQALRELSERAGRKLLASEESTGAGVAMVVKLGDKSALLAEAGVLIGMLSDDEQARDICIDTALHELCHVYDEARTARLWADDLRRGTLQPMQNHVFTSAHAAWSEYFANRYSNTAHSSPNSQPKYLSEVVPAVVREVREAIKAHLAQPDLRGVLAFCQQKVHYLFQWFGYAAGRLSANEAALEDVAPESVEALEAAGLYSIFLGVHIALNDSDEERDSWSSFDDLQPLMDLADAAFRVLGVNYVLDESGHRVHIA